MNSHSNLVRRAGGFTLIEMMIVAVVISILAAIAIPSYQDSVRKGRRSAAQALLSEMANKQQQYLADARAYALGAAGVTTLGYGTLPKEVNGFYTIDTGGTPTPVTVATVTTGTTHPFVAGGAVTIAGGDVQSTLYTGVKTVLAAPAPTATAFSYNITTDVPCSDSGTSRTAAAGGTDSTTLIRWVRGQDSLGDEASPGGSINVRPSIHGDVLHSRPAVINYGGSTGVVVFYGDNSGVFHAVNGNQTAAIGSVPAGGELWGFIPPEFFPKLMRQYLNSPVVKLEATAGSILPAPQPKDYFFDGSMGVYQNGATVHLFITARRGGRVLYALDISDPAAPRFMWKKTNADAGFSELGQTWSVPKVTLVKGYNTGSPNFTPKPVLIFGAGYDPAEDAEPPTARTMGRGIFVLDAETGAVVWQARTGGAAGVTTCTGNPCLLDMAYPIAADVTILDRDLSDAGDYTDRIYAADLGGNVWRVDLQPLAGNAPANWQVTKFADVGGSGATKRKIFFAPDVLAGSTFDRVIFTTGDREHPTRTQLAVNILNRFYMLKDTKTGNDNCPLVAGVPTCSATITDSTPAAACVPGSLPKTAPGTGSAPATSCTEAVPAGIFNASAVLPTSASAIQANAGLAYDNSGNGFYINLLNAVAHLQPDNSVLYGPEIQAGEKGVNAPTSIGGNTFFGTNTPIPPTAGVCQPNLGTSRGYAVDFLTGVYDFREFDGGGLPPSPVAGVVVVDGVSVPFIIGGVPPPNTVVSGTTVSGSTVGGSGLGGSGGGGGGGGGSGALEGGAVEIDVKAIRTRTYWYRDIGNR